MSQITVNAMNAIADAKQDIYDRVRSGQTEQKFQIGADAMSDSEWDKLMKKVDNFIDSTKEADEELAEKKDKEEELKALYEKGQITSSI
ncbi:MAG: hypothetical protein K5840_08280 [Eubacterium sp.]|nr:hypothetical protein [Eubacterium sp.]